MRRALATLGGLGLALALSQFPEYAQQYEQRLGGAVNELRIIVEDFDADALKFGLSREKALQRYMQSPDDFIVARGMSMARTLARYGKLSADLRDLQNAGPLQRLQHIGDYFDSEIGAAAAAAYKPAMPVTGEGLMWALGGFILGYIIVAAFIGFVTLPFRWRNGRQPHYRVPVPRLRRDDIVREAVSIEDVARHRELMRRANEPTRRVERAET